MSSVIKLFAEILIFIELDTETLVRFGFFQITDQSYEPSNTGKKLQSLTKS